MLYFFLLISLFSFNDLSYVVQRMKEEFLEMHKPKERNPVTTVKGWSRPSGD
jgi:hypothetical protein